MFACEYKFFPKKEISSEDFLQDFWSFVGELGRGGQTVNEDSMIQDRSFVRYLCICPEKESLNARHHTSYARKTYKKLLEASVRKPQIKVLGEIVEAPSACKCKTRPFLFLLTNFLDQSSPVVCGKCWCPVPLYHLPPLKNGNYGDYLAWQENYRSCDSLYMLSRVGEKFGYKQLSELKSELTKFGRGLCAFLEKQTGVPVYYYLHHYYGATAEAESKRRCPKCKGNWLLKEPIGRYGFCCQKCRLFSEIAPRFQKPSWK